MREEEFRDELRRLIDINRPAKAEVSLYVTRVLRGDHITADEDAAFQHAIDQVEETWPRITALLRKAPHEAPPGRHPL